MYSCCAERPWQGRGPLQSAELAGRLSAETVAALGDGVSGPRGSVLAIPTDCKGATIGTGAREAYRQFLFGVIQPLGRIVEHELSMKMEQDIKLDWSELRAADIAGRARVFKSLVDSDMELKKAAAVTGLLSADG